jgi:hypothetical protein
MQYDFTTYYKLCIDYYKNNELILKTHILENTAIYHNFNNTQNHDAQIDTALQKYKYTEIYKYNNWVFNTDMEQYQQILNKLGIESKSLVHMWMHGQALFK